MYKFKFADIGEGLHEGKVGEIYKQVGDLVKEGDSLFSVETDKVTSDIPSPVDGKITKVLIEQGSTVHVGDDVFYFQTDQDNEAPADEPAPAEKTSEETAANAGASVVGEVKVSNDLLNMNTTTTANNKTTASRVLATPLARHLAAKKGIDIETVQGSGYNGRILVKDIEQSSQSGATKAANKKTIVPGQVQKIKPDNVRKAIANAMKNSWANVAYTNLVTEVNMTSLWNQRKATLTHPKVVEKMGVKVTFLPFIAKAVAIALESFPQLNAKYDVAEDTINQYGDKNIGIAVDTPHGLFVPVVKNVEQKNLVEIAKEVGSLAALARDKKLKASDMQGGTFTISNYGSVGALYGVPVINFPEIGIIGAGSIIDRVYANVDNNGFYNGKVMHLTVAADHRWVDGATIGRFLTKVKQILENPILLIGELNV